MYRLVYNKHLLDADGHFRAERLQLLGLMRCKHPDIDSRYMQFWEFVNPELQEEIPAGDVMDLIEEMAVMALPVLQEAFSGEDTKHKNLHPGVLKYLSTVEPKMEATVKLLCKQILRKGSNAYDHTQRVTYSFRDFEKFVPSEILQPAGFRLYCQFYDPSQKTTIERKFGRTYYQGEYKDE